MYRTNIYFLENDNIIIHYNSDKKILTVEIYEEHVFNWWIKIPYELLEKAQQEKADYILATYLSNKKVTICPKTGWKTYE